jgi:MFS family permease
MVKQGWQRYHTIWAMLFLGWMVSFIDRVATGPVVTWMISNKVSFLADASNAHGLGGLIGSLFFAGFMLNQFPGGYFGDKFGYRTIVIISILWAGIATILTGITGGLITFVILRVLLGLGEGTFYSNDRSYIVFNTPPEKVGLGMGVVISGAAVGLTVGTLGTPLLIKAMEPAMGIQAWRSPFFIMGVVTLIVVFLMYKYMRPETVPGKEINTDNPGYKEDYKKAFSHMAAYSAVFLVIIMAIYFGATNMGISDIGIAFILVLLCPILIIYLYITKKSDIKPVITNKNLFMIYLYNIPQLWHLWFYGFWATAIVKDFGGGALLTAALVASFNAVAGIIGYPLGGKISDKLANRPNGRRNVLAVLTALLTVSIFIFAAYMIFGNHNPVIESIILFISGLFFFATGPVSHALTADLAPSENRGTAFGVMNLIAEVGAVLSPVVSGVIRDSTGSWGTPLLLDGVLMALSLLCVLAISNKAIKTISNQTHISH